MTEPYQYNAAQHALFDTLLGKLRWEVIELGLQTGLFDDFDCPNNASDVAAHSGWQSEPLTLLLNAYVSIHIMHKEGDLYRLNADYRRYLCRQSQDYLGDALLSLAQIRQLPADKALTWLTAKTDQDCAITMRQPQFWQQAHQRLRSFHVSTRNPGLLPLLQNLPQWQDGLHMLDMGAGTAELAKILVAQQPASRVTLFDLPPCCHVITHSLQGTKWQDSDRIRVLAGDMNEGQFDGPYQVVLAAMSLYFADDLTACIKALWNSVAPGGVLISYHEALNQERTAPAFHILGRLPAELANGALSLPFGQVEQELTACEPTDITRQVVDTPYGTMSFIAAHKPA